MLTVLAQPNIQDKSGLKKPFCSTLLRWNLFCSILVRITVVRSKCNQRLVLGPETLRAVAQNLTTDLFGACYFIQNSMADTPWVHCYNWSYLRSSRSCWFWLSETASSVWTAGRAGRLPSPEPRRPAAPDGGAATWRPEKDTRAQRLWVRLRRVKSTLGRLGFKRIKSGEKKRTKKTQARTSEAWPKALDLMEARRSALLED